jgi:hypothetical protein
MHVKDANKNVSLPPTAQVGNGAGALIPTTVAPLSREFTPIQYKVPFGQDVVPTKSSQGLFVLKNVLGKVSVPADRIALH